MGLFSSIAKLGRKLVGSAVPLGKKFITGKLISGLGKKAADLATGLASKVLDSDVGKTITGGIMKGAELGDSLTGGSFGLKRKAEELESAVRSGKLAQEAVDFAQRKAARRLTGQ